ncbi:epigen [Scophthalmus maximus]|nr:epigen [Scophthalmus maximus]
MFTHRRANLETGLLSSVAVLMVLLATTGQSAILPSNLQTTATPPALSNSSLTTQINNGSAEGPRVLRSHRSCGGGYEHFCENGGECIYPQDTDKPSCICTSSYEGPRCLIFSDSTRTLPELEQLIGIIFGVAVLLLVLAIVIYCFAYRRCVKSASLIKSPPSETSE